MTRTATDAFLPGPPGWALDWDGLDAAFPWLRKLRGVTSDPGLLAKGKFWTQDPRHHAEGDVWTHTRMVVQELVAGAGFRTAPERDRRVLFAAALLHDVCKPETWAIEADGSVTNKGHSRTGANEARQVLWRMNWDFADRERVCALIAAHQVPFWLIDRPDWQAVQVLAGTSLQVENRLLAVLAEADARGRVCADRDRIVDNVELFREAARDAGCYDVPFPFFNDHARVQYFRNPELRDPRAELHDTTSGAFTVTMMSGLPASGKSTWIAQETAPGGLVEGQSVVSMDRMRMELGVRPDDDQGAVRQAATKRARELLAARQPFVWDAVNLDKQRRAPLAGLCGDYGARLRIVYAEAPEAEMRARNRARVARVPDTALGRMLRRWDPPTLAECHELVIAVVTPAAFRAGQVPACVMGPPSTMGRRVRLELWRAYAIRTRTVPTPATIPSSTSPRTQAATPSGVPVKIRSPASRRTRRDR